MVGPAPVASSTAFAADEAVRAGAHVDHQHARDSGAVPGGDELDGAVLLEPAYVEREHLLHHPVDDLDTGEIALVHGAIEALAGKRLLVEGPVRIAVEEAPDLVLELTDALDRALDQPPRQILPGQPFAADDGIHEVAFDGVLRSDRDVVAPLHHACAAGLAEQPLDRHRDLGVRVGLLRVQRGEQPGPARAQDEDVGAVALDVHVTRPREMPVRPLPRFPRSSRSTPCADRATDRAPAPAASRRARDGRRGAPRGPIPPP